MRLDRPRKRKEKKKGEKRKEGWRLQHLGPVPSRTNNLEPEAAEMFDERERERTYTVAPDLRKTKLRDSSTPRTWRVYEGKKRKRGGGRGSNLQQFDEGTTVRPVCRLIERKVPVSEKEEGKGKGGGEEFRDGHRLCVHSCSSGGGLHGGLLGIGKRFLFVPGKRERKKKKRKKTAFLRSR